MHYRNNILLTMKKYGYNIDKNIVRIIFNNIATVYNINIAAILLQYWYNISIVLMTSISLVASTYNSRVQ